MIYLKSFRLASKEDEDGYMLSYPYQQEMQCYSTRTCNPSVSFPKIACVKFLLSPSRFFTAETVRGKMQADSNRGWQRKLYAGGNGIESGIVCGA